MFFSYAGSSIFLAVAQGLFLNRLLPQLQKVDSSITAIDIVRAGAIGLKDLVPKENIETLLSTYARSLSVTFYVAVGTAGLATILGFGVEWKSLKRRDENSKEVK